MVVRYVYIDESIFNPPPMTLKERYYALQADLIEAVADKARSLADGNGNAAINPLFGNCTPKAVQLEGMPAVVFDNSGIELTRPLVLMGCDDLISLAEWLQFAEDCSWM